MVRLYYVNGPIMKNITERQREIVLIVNQNPGLSKSAVLEKLNEEVSPTTIKRELAALVEGGFLSVEGKGPATVYRIDPEKILFLPIDVHEYYQIEPDNRSGATRYDHDLLEAVPASLFDVDEMRTLKEATKKFQSQSKGDADVLRKKELERFVIPNENRTRFGGSRTDIRED